jgi:hypothetical protein
LYVRALIIQGFFVSGVYCPHRVPPLKGAAFAGPAWDARGRVFESHRLTLFFNELAQLSRVGLFHALEFTPADILASGRAEFSGSFLPIFLL